MATRSKEFKPAVWIFQHDGISMEFATLEAAVAYVRGFKSICNTAFGTSCFLNFKRIKGPIAAFEQISDVSRIAR